MKKFILALLMVLGISFASQAQVYISSTPIQYGKTLVWVEVDGEWVQTFLYDTYCYDCGHYYHCPHRYLNAPLYEWRRQITNAAVVGTIVYLTRPQYRPVYYHSHYDACPHHHEWYHPKDVYSRPYAKPAPQYHPKPIQRHPAPVPQQHGTHNVAPHKTYESSSDYHRPSQSAPRSTPSTRSSSSYQSKPSSSNSQTKSYQHSNSPRPQSSSSARSSSSSRSSAPASGRTSSSARSTSSTRH